MECWKFNDANKAILKKIIEITRNDSPALTQSKLHALFLNHSKIGENSEITKSNTDIIVLSDDSSDEAVQEVEDNIHEVEHMQIDDNSTNTQQNNTGILSDYHSYLVDTLESENGLITDEDFREILNSNYHKTIFSTLEKKLSMQGIFNICISVTNLQISNVEYLVSQLCQDLLLPKFLNVELSRIVESGILELNKKFPSIIVEKLISQLLHAEHPNAKIVISICEQLNQEHKKILLRKLIFDCEKIEERHLELLHVLFVSDCEDSIKIRLIELFHDCSDSFCNSKAYGKLLLLILKSLNSNFEEYESTLKYIVNQNKSIFKRQAMKILDTLFLK